MSAKGSNLKRTTGLCPSRSYYSMSQGLYTLYSTAHVQLYFAKVNKRYNKGSKSYGKCKIKGSYIYKTAFVNASESKKILLATELLPSYFDKIYVYTIFHKVYRPTKKPIATNKKVESIRKRFTIPRVEIITIYMYWLQTGSQLQHCAWYKMRSNDVYIK